MLIKGVLLKNFFRAIALAKSSTSGHARPLTGARVIVICMRPQENHTAELTYDKLR